MLHPDIRLRTRPYRWLFLPKHVLKPLKPVLSAVGTVGDCRQISPIGLQKIAPTVGGHFDDWVIGNWNHV